jgi:cytochrome c oxidase cbb3-type subunit I/II
MIRPFRSETERYGPYSKAGEYVYDHPFLWGSKRTGPDLLRLGKKYPDAWHYKHMENPESTSPGSIMPRYPWLIANRLDTSTIQKKISVLRTLGVPYPEGFEDEAMADMQRQADGIVANLKSAMIEVEADREIIAMIAYMQRLGTDVRTDLDVEVTR